MKRCYLTFIACIICLVGGAQTINPALLKKEWSASWITVPNTSPTAYGIYLFRKTISLTKQPDSFIVHLSADNRYRLFVNGKIVASGPARGDLSYWNFETIDISSFLQKGKNTVAALVWNEGEIRPEGQISNRTAFLLQGNGGSEEILNTDNQWKCRKNTAYEPIRGIGYNAYYVSGPGERIDMNAMPSGWVENDYDDSDWINALPPRGKPAPKGGGDIPGWMLVPSQLPQMELKPQRFAAVRQKEGIELSESFPVSISPVTIPANTTATVLLDQSFLSNAYPVMRFSKGKNAGILFIYAETLFNEIPDAAGKSFHKGNRNDIEGKFIAGRKDSIISNGLNKQEFMTLNYRTFRYIQIRITTKDEPLIIDDIYSLSTGYPFKMNAVFEAGDSTLNKIIEIGWRTARACAMDTYMDCPYYEQLQYIGDTRIQALVSFYNSGDDRLVRNAIEQMDHSRIAEGITLSRHPSFSPQQIPTFSLWYIGMVHDYWMYRGDSVFIKDKLQGIRNILWFYEKHQQADGSLRNVPYWNYTDWLKDNPSWKKGIAPIGTDGSSSVLDLQLLWAYQLAASLEVQLGLRELSIMYQRKASQLQQNIRKIYWDTQKGMYADNSDKNSYSQHANSLAILTQTIVGNEAALLAKKTLADTLLAPASIYFKYYLHLALIKAGLGNDYLKWLGKWKENIAMGLTTWAELSEIDKSRSDCHAWGASPNIEFFRTILGIDTDAPGFKKIKIEPHPGDLKSLQGRMPHPNGSVSVNYQLLNGKWKMIIDLPKNISGKLVWKSKTYPLKPGVNTLTL